MQIAKLRPKSTREDVDVLHISKEDDRIIGFDADGLQCFGCSAKPQRLVLGDITPLFVKTSRGNYNSLYVATSNDVYELSRTSMKAKKIHGPTPEPIKFIRVSDNTVARVLIVCSSNMYVEQDKQQQLIIPITGVMDACVLGNGCVCCITTDKFLIFGKDGRKKLQKHGPSGMSTMCILGKIGFAISDVSGGIHLFDPKTQNFSLLYNSGSPIKSMHANGMGADALGGDLHCIFVVSKQLKGIVTRDSRFEGEIKGLPVMEHISEVIPCGFMKDGGIAILLEDGQLMWYDTLSMAWGSDNQYSVVLAQYDVSLKAKYKAESHELLLSSEVPITCLAICPPLDVRIVSTEPICNIMVNRRGWYVISCPPTQLVIKLEGEGNGLATVIATNIPNRGGLERAYEMKVDIGSGAKEAETE